MYWVAILFGASAAENVQTAVAHAGKDGEAATLIPQSWSRCWRQPRTQPVSIGVHPTWRVRYHLDMLVYNQAQSLAAQQSRSILQCLLASSWSAMRLKLYVSHMFIVGSFPLVRCILERPIEVGNTSAVCQQLLMWVGACMATDSGVHFHMSFWSWSRYSMRCS